MLAYGKPPYLECSSRGDKRFSAFAARIRARGNASIETLYQSAKIFADGATGLGWREAKGRRAVNAKECAALYATLWDEYMAENPDLMPVLLAASGVRIQYVFLAVFAFGAGLAGMAGIVGGTFQSLSPGEDTRFLLASLVVVIVGGMGSIPGAAIGALVIGLSEQIGLVYAPTYSVVFTFLIMAAVLAFRPQGLLGSTR